MKQRHFANPAEAELALDGVFHALADGTRRQLLARLARGPASVGELAEPFAMSLPAVSKHLVVLREAGLIEQEKSGRLRTCHLNAAGMQDASQWLAFYEHFWSAQLDALEAFLIGQPAPLEKNHDTA